MNRTEELLLSEGKILPIMEEFYTIQGEGAFTGVPAYFIRIGGCDVGCHWCDVKESWNADLHPAKPTNTVVENCEKYAKTAVITGGEPLMWNLDYLTSSLRKNHIKTHIETSGAYDLSGDWDWFCLSPKKTKLPTKEAYEIANELKVIVYNKHDFKFAEEQASLVNENCQLYLQSEWSKKDEITPLIVDYVMENPKWRISLQTHKYLNIP